MSVHVQLSDFKRSGHNGLIESGHNGLKSMKQKDKKHLYKNSRKSLQLERVPSEPILPY